MSLEFAKQLRKNMTEWEIRIWSRIRRNKSGVRFHRQEPIGKYIADFACRSLWLIIEIDSKHHDYSYNDIIRDKYLESLGWEILRYTNEDVRFRLNDICGYIEKRVAEKSKLNLKPASRNNL